MNTLWNSTLLIVKKEKLAVPATLIGFLCIPSQISIEAYIYLSFFWRKKKAVCDLIYNYRYSKDKATELTIWLCNTFAFVFFFFNSPMWCNCSMLFRIFYFNVCSFQNALKRTVIAVHSLNNTSRVTVCMAPWVRYIIQFKGPFGLI